MPKSVSYRLPDNSVSISYALETSDNAIRILYRRNINKLVFLPTEYKDLKEIYDQMIKKHAEQIILKKNG
jgi:hypothetical protein